MKQLIFEVGNEKKRFVLRTKIILLLVMLQPNPAGQIIDHFKDKFMVQWTVIPADSAENVETLVRNRNQTHS